MTQLAVVNRDDEIAAHLADSRVPQLRFGLQRPECVGDYGVMDVEGCEYLAYWPFNAQGPVAVMPTQQIALMGRHNISNCLAALALCQSFDLSLETIIAVLRCFSGLPHRTQLIRTHHGVHWINDSKGTNVGSTVSALASLGGQAKIVLLAGGQGKGQDFSALAAPMAEYGRALIVFGEDGEQIAHACDGVCRIERVPDLAQAVSLAAQLAQCGDVVLLSPACASFDQFKSYVHRGEVFTDLVVHLS